MVGGVGIGHHTTMEDLCSAASKRCYICFAVWQTTFNYFFSELFAGGVVKNEVVQVTEGIKEKFKTLAGLYKDNGHYFFEVLGSSGRT